MRLYAKILFVTEPNLVLFTKSVLPLILMLFSVPALIKKRRSFRSSDSVYSSLLLGQIRSDGNARSAS